MTYDQLVQFLSSKYPKFEVRQKSGSTLMKLIHFLLVVITFGKNKMFMTDFVTTIGFKVYVPESWTAFPETDKKLILIHESVHMDQITREHWLLYTLKYLLWPLPVGYADCRLDYEAEAYARQLWEKTKLGFPVDFDFVAQFLSGSDYFWPTFSKEKAKLRVAHFYSEILLNLIKKQKSSNAG